MAEVKKALANPRKVAGVTIFSMVTEIIAFTVLLIIGFSFFEGVMIVAPLVLVVLLHVVNMVLTEQDPDRDKRLQMKLRQIMIDLGLTRKQGRPPNPNGKDISYYGP